MIPASRSSEPMRWCRSSPRERNSQKTRGTMPTRGVIHSEKPGFQTPAGSSQNTVKRSP